MIKVFLQYAAWFLLGSTLLSSFSAVQKLLVGIPFHPKGFLVPIFFGGCCGLILNVWRRKWKHSTRSLLESEARYRSLYDNAPVMLHSIDTHGRLLTVSKFWLETLGYHPSEVLGHKLTDFMTQTSRQMAEQTIFPKFFRTGSVKYIPYQFVKKNGDIVEVLLSAIGDRNTQGHIERSLAVAIDVTEHRQAELEVKKLAYYDTLTELPNRTLFHDRLGQALAHARRNNARVEVLFLDLDRFKVINDTLGHAVGDEFLKIIAQRLRDCMRQGDTVARLGGDEFVIVLSSSNGDQDGAAFAERILETLAQPVKLAGGELCTTASIGISIYPLDGEDIDTLLRNADIAMYAAKEHGRNNYQFFSDEMNTRVVEKLGIETNLRRALDRGELFLTYQPQIDIESGTIIGVESLLRWNHPQEGLISPEKFIPIAEETGLINPIGEWALRTACRQAREWQIAGYAPVRMAVNLSARQFKQLGIIDLLDRILEETGLDPKWLELELTESLIMDNTVETIMTLTDIKVRGIHLAIDDFGTGYSSLAYLKNFPIDRIKIAQEFIHSVNDDADSRAIVEAIIAMSHSLQLNVLAEGVENLPQLEFLTARQCHEMQGFYFSPPCTAAEMGDLFAMNVSKAGFCLLHERTSQSSH
ncbi:MAG: EAL domain-containing protein [Desulfuromonadales bacterium]